MEEEKIDYMESLARVVGKACDDYFERKNLKPKRPWLNKKQQDLLDERDRLERESKQAK